jgi:hypothetical protein
MWQKKRVYRYDGKILLGYSQESSMRSHVSLWKRSRVRLDLYRREEGKMTIGAEAGVMLPQVKEPWQPPEARRAETDSPCEPSGKYSSPDTLISAPWSGFWTFALQNYERINVHCFQLQISGNLSQQSNISICYATMSEVLFFFLNWHFLFILSLISYESRKWSRVGH